MRNTTLTILATATLWACSDATDVAEFPVPAAAQEDIFGMAPEGAEPRDIAAMTGEERDAYGAALVQMQIDLERAMAEPGGWREADLRTRSLLNDYPEVEDYKVQQTAATMILRSHLLTADPDEEKAEAIGYYTDALIESGSPNAPLVERALASLDGHWTDEKVAAAAAAAAAAGERFVAKRADRGGMATPEALRRATPTGPSDTRAARVAASVERLRAIAG